MYKQNMVVLILFYIAIKVNCLLNLSHEIANSNGNENQEIILSSNGTYFITANSNMSLVIYTESLGIYTFNQIFSGTQQINGIFLVNDCSHIIVSRKNSFEVLRHSGSSFVKVQTVGVPFSIRRAQITSDKKNIVACGNDRIVTNYKLNNNGLYSLLQTLDEMSDQIMDIQFTSDGSYLAMSGMDEKVRVYQRNTNGFFILFQHYTESNPLKEIDIVNNQLIVTVLDYNAIDIKKMSSLDYQGLQRIQTSTILKKLLVDQNRECMLVSSSNVLYLYVKNNTDNYMYEVERLTFNCQIYGIAMSDSKTKIILSTSQGLKFYNNCPANCANCSSPDICFNCQLGYQLNAFQQCILSNIVNTTDNNTVSNETYNETISNATDNQTISNATDNNTISNVTDNVTINSTIDMTYSEQIDQIDSQINQQALTEQLGFCVDNKTINGICIKYCAPECVNCSGNATNCQSCSNFYQQNSNSQCTSPNNQLEILSIIYGIFSIFRVSKMKTFFFLLDDLWLFQYHKPSYEGAIAEIFDVTRIIQSKKDKVLDLDNHQFFANILVRIDVYNSRANLKYLSIERIGDSIPQNIIEFLALTLPLTLLIFLFAKIIFKCLFKFKISKFLRELSFNGLLPIMLIEGNIEYFIFLGLRQAGYICHLDFFQKVLSSFSITFVYPFFLYCFVAYPLLKKSYEKLFKYFLNNLFRINGCVLLMSLIYCVRPLIKGVFHSILYENNSLQLLLLSLTDLLVLVIVWLVEINQGIFKGKLMLTFLSSYLICGIILNALLYGNVQYQKDGQVFSLIDSITRIIIFMKISTILLASFVNLLELHQFQKKQLEQIEQIDAQNQEAKIIINQLPPKNNSSKNFEEESIYKQNNQTECVQKIKVKRHQSQKRRKKCFKPLPEKKIYQKGQNLYIINQHVIH